MAEEEKARFRQMILNLSNLIKTEEELGKMVFFCKDLIKAGQRDKIKDFLTLITHLEERKKVGPTNLTFLKDMLRTSTNGRRDVFDPIEQYEGPVQMTIDATPEYNLANGGRQRGYTNPGNVPSLNQCHPSTSPQLTRAQRWYIRPHHPPWNLELPIELLKKKLARDWRFFMRALKVEDEEIENVMDEYPRNVKEQIHQTFKIYLNRTREQSCKQDLIDACKTIRRNDLARKLEANDFR